MQSDSGHTTSLWMGTTDLPQFQPITQDLRTNVCVVGAGIAGLTTAYLLARAGRAVVVIDDGPIGGGETSRTTAHLTAALDDRYYNIEKLHGEEGAKIAAESHMSAIHRIESIASMEDIDCDLERVEGYLFLGGKDTRKDLERELAATHRAGLTDTQIVDRIPFSFWDSGPALRFPRQATFHPLKYLRGLVRAILRDGGRIYTGVHAEKIVDGEPGKITTTGGHVISADNIVVCTNTPVNDWLIIHSKQAAYRTYVIAARVPKGAVPHGLYWDTPDPYHYIRLQAAEDKSGRELDYEMLIVGGEDHKTGQADDTTVHHERLERWARERYPSAAASEAACRARLRHRAWAAIPAIIAATNSRTGGDSVARLTIAGPGQRPTRPQPVPNSTAPTISGRSIAVRVGHAAISARTGRSRRRASANPGIETMRAAAITIASVGSQPPFGIASTSRKPSTLAVSVIPETTSPAPNMRPQRNAERIGMARLTMRDA